jgi:hypothetical protein
MMLAQTLPDPNHFASIGWVAVTIVAILGGVYVAVCLWEKIQSRPSGGEVRSETHEKFATKPEVAAVKAELNKRIDDVDEDLQAQKKSIVENGEKRKTSIEGKVEASRLELKKDIEGVATEARGTAREVSKLEGKFDQINLTLIGLTSAVQNLQNNQGKE